MKKLFKFQKLTFKRKKIILLDKRQRFTIQTLILTAGLLTTQLIWEDYRFVMVLILSILSYVLTIWSLSEDVKGIEWGLLFILPVFFTASVSLFYFLLPGRWITRLMITVVFSVGTYAILLVENIYNVAVARSIQLLRAAHSVGLLVTLVVIFLVTNIIYSLRLPFWQNMIIVVVSGFVLALQSLWSIKLETKISTEFVILSILVGIVLGELAGTLSFWPVENSTYSLLISASYYTIAGVIQQHLLGRLFNNIIREYIIVFIFCLVLTYLSAQWG